MSIRRNAGCSFLFVVLVLLSLFGEIRCACKMCTCNWDPIGKAEIFYTIGTFTGAGCIIGYFNIPDK